MLILALALINYLLVYYLPSVATREGGASEDSGAEKSMFVSLCADGDDENSVWWMCYVLVFLSSARGEGVGETKCCLFCLATLRFTNKSHRIRSSTSSYFEVRINFSVLVRSSFNFFGR